MIIQDDERESLCWKVDIFKFKKNGYLRQFSSRFFDFWIKDRKS